MKQGSKLFTLMSIFVIFPLDHCTAHIPVQHTTSCAFWDSPYWEIFTIACLKYPPFSHSSHFAAASAGLNYFLLKASASKLRKKVQKRKSVGMSSFSVRNSRESRTGDEDQGQDLHACGGNFEKLVAAFEKRIKDLCGAFPESHDFMVSIKQSTVSTLFVESNSFILGK